MGWKHSSLDQLVTKAAGLECQQQPLPLQGLYNVIKSCFSGFLQTRSDGIIAARMGMFNCLPVVDAIAKRRNIQNVEIILLLSCLKILIFCCCRIWV